jgi:hypothetical protein
MSRALPTGFAALASAPVFRPAILVDLAWPSGTIYVWNGYGTLSWNGHTYQGTGHLGDVSGIGESKDGRANGVTLTLGGIPSTMIADALANDAQGRSAKIWLAAFADDGTLGADPYPIFDGVIDISPVEDNGTEATISVQLEKELIDRRINNWRNTHEDQQIDYPGDMFFEFVAGLADKEVVWGGKTISGSAATAGGVDPGGTSAGGGADDDTVNKYGGGRIGT